MQAPTKEFRDKYFPDFTVVKLNNSNNTKVIENEIKPNYDWSGVNYTFDFQNIKDNIDYFIDIIIPKVCVIGRFQPLHKGHTIPIDKAFALSPYVDIAIRKEETDTYTLDEVKENITKMYRPQNVIFTPPLDDADWSFIEEYDIIVQGNPVVIDKIKPYLKELEFVPRIGSVSGTYIRKTNDKSFI
jgi:glycerol-3-phosphate cytidylyltransferase-like family protein